MHPQAPGASASADAADGIERTFARAEDWLRHRPPGRFFLLVHTYEVHAPYRRTRFAAGTPRGRLGETFELADVERVRQGQLELGPIELAYLERLYDGGVRAADTEVGKLLATLEDLGLAGRTLVVVTADHGEDLGGRDPRYAGDHGHALYEEQVRIPLIVADPALAPEVGGSGPRRVAEPVRLLDVMPTVLDRLDVAVPDGGEGVSLGPWLRGGEAPGRPALLRLFPRGGGRHGPVRTGFRDGEHKVIVSVPFVDPPEPPVELFDLATDPGERDNLADRRPALRDALLARMRVASDALAADGLPNLSGRGEPSEALRRRLESLGYAR